MALLQAIETLGRWAHFLARCGASLGAIRYYPAELVRQFHQIYLGALPLAGAVGLALGVVIWLHLHGVLARLDAGYTRLLPEYLALAVVLEFAPLGAGLILAGRSGASLSAELGSMKLTEQIDALEVMGQAPLKVLVAPRVAACMAAAPLLTAVIGACALVGGFAAEAMGGTMSWQEYANASLRDLRLKDVILATVKTVAFGFLIGATACHVGMTAEGSTEGVGRAATRGVVWSIFLVVVADVFLVRTIQVFG